MKWKFKNNLYLLFQILFVMFTFSQTFGQKLVECNVNGLEKPKFKIAFTSNGKTLGLEIIVNPKNQTDENLVHIARYIRQKYCKEEIISIMVFDKKDDAREFTVYNVKQIPDTLRAIYYLDRDKGKEYLVRIKVIDNKQVETQISLSK